MEDKIKVPVLAKDNRGFTYDVYLKADSQGPVLDIVRTPGKWYLKTLMEFSERQEIALDSGQGWYCTNFREVLLKALEII